MVIAIHIPVMEKELITGLNIKSNGSYIDATFGRGGHTRAILEKLGPDGRVLVIDKDPDAILAAKKLQVEDPRISIYHGSYTNMQQFSETEKVFGKIDGIILDLGLSSPQLDEANRGFSFMKDGPLDMRMDPTSGVSAADWLKNANSDEIASVLKVYGEEKHAKLIANAICRAMQEQPITTTKRLADIISNVYPRKYELHKHPATRSFQGIRIFINNELEDLKKALEPVVSILNFGGRLVIISFHSLEDRIVKQFIANEAKGDIFPRMLPVMASQLQPTLKKFGKQKPQEDEILRNVRARSAILRVAEKLPMRLQ